MNCVITSKGKRKDYLCDYCKQIFDKHKMHEMKLRSLTGNLFWGDNRPGTWFYKKFVCEMCFHQRFYIRD